MHETPMIRPPLGVPPRRVHRMDRYRELIAAIDRYVEAGKPIPGDWTTELHELLDELFPLTIAEKITKACREAFG